MKSWIASSLSLICTTTVFAQSPSRFDQWDRSGDGKLSREEIPPPLRRNFDRVDTDGDGFISREEDRVFTSRRGGEPSSPEGVRRISGIDYAGTGNPRHQLDLYLPENPKSDGPLPVVCWIHGGGWRQGSKDRARLVVDLVATGRFAGASLGYRLSGEAQWPAQIHDVKAAIRWIRANAGAHGIDPERIGLWGSSAGGHLVAMLGVSEGVDHLEGEVGPHLDLAAEVTCVVNYYGPSDLLSMNRQGSRMDHDAADSPESQLIGGPVQENPDRARDASPLTHVNAGDRPMLLVHGTEDPLVPFEQSVVLEQALEKAGVTAILLTVDGAGHGNGFGPRTREVAARFLESILLDDGPLPRDETIAAGE